jgi:UDP:flavonoid glycosyltransferase YjiC (YdhE family)
VEQVGFVRNDRGEAGEIPAAVQSLLACDEPPILVTAGTGLFVDAGFYLASAEACRLLQRRGILVTGHRKLAARDLPDGVRCFDRLPFASLMPRVGVVVHHGGTGTLARAIVSAVPQLALPSGGDRPDTALHLRRLGIAEVLLPAQWQPDLIAEALQRLSSSTAVRERCQELARLARRGDPAGAACETIESAVLTKPSLRDADSLPVVDEGSSSEAEQSPLAKEVLERLEGLSPGRRELLARRLKAQET